MAIHSECRIRAFPNATNAFIVSQSSAEQFRVGIGQGSPIVMQAQISNSITTAIIDAGIQMTAHNKTP